MQEVFWEDFSFVGSGNYSHPSNLAKVFPPKIVSEKIDDDYFFSSGRYALKKRARADRPVYFYGAGPNYFHDIWVGGGGVVFYLDSSGAHYIDKAYEVEVSVCALWHQQEQVPPFGLILFARNREFAGGDYRNFYRFRLGGGQGGNQVFLERIAQGAVVWSESTIWSYPGGQEVLVKLKWREGLLKGEVWTLGMGNKLVSLSRDGVEEEVEGYAGVWCGVTQQGFYLDFFRLKMKRSFE